MTVMKKRRGGWPARTPEPGERVPMSFRATPEIKQKLDKAAALNGRSLSQEIELRLDLSLQRMSAFDEAIELGHGRQIASLLMLMGRVMKDTGTHAGFISSGTVEGTGNWLSDPFAFDQVAKAVATALEAFRPAGEPMPPAGYDTAQTERFTHLGELLAKGTIEAVKNPDRGGEIGEWAGPVREKLGAAVDQITVDDSLVMVSAARPGPSSPGILATLGRGTPPWKKEDKS